MEVRDSVKAQRTPWFMWKPESYEIQRGTNRDLWIKSDLIHHQYQVGWRYGYKTNDYANLCQRREYSISSSVFLLSAVALSYVWLYGLFRHVTTAGQIMIDDDDMILSIPFSSEVMLLGHFMSWWAANQSLPCLFIITWSVNWGVYQWMFCGVLYL